MTKRAVWIFCFIIAVLSVGSVAYRMALVTHFDAKAWREADEPSEFLDRRAMMPEVEQMFASGKIGTRDAAEKILGQPERIFDDEHPNIWYYNLGGQSASSAPDSNEWLELTFDAAGKLVRYRRTQEVVIPPG
jgi:hypothetical protein